MSSKRPPAATGPENSVPRTWVPLRTGACMGPHCHANATHWPAPRVPRPSPTLPPPVSSSSPPSPPLPSLGYPSSSVAETRCSILVPGGVSSGTLCHPIAGSGGIRWPDPRLRLRKPGNLDTKKGGRARKGDRGARANIPVVEWRRRVVGDELAFAAPSLAPCGHDRRVFASVAEKKKKKKIPEELGFSAT